MPSELSGSLFGVVSDGVGVSDLSHFKDSVSFTLVDFSAVSEVQNNILIITFSFYLL